MPEAKRTTDHETIRRWVEERGGHPARVRGTGNSDGTGAILRIDYPGYKGEDTLERIDWERFFAEFENNGLAFLYQDETSEGQTSRFSKLVRRVQTAARRRSARK